VDFGLWTAERSVAGDQHSRHCRDALALEGKKGAFGSLGLQADPVDGDIEQARDALAYREIVRLESGAVTDEDAVGVD